MRQTLPFLQHHKASRFSSLRVDFLHRLPQRAQRRPVRRELEASRVHDEYQVLRLMKAPDRTEVPRPRLLKASSVVGNHDYLPQVFGAALLYHGPKVFEGVSAGSPYLDLKAVASRQAAQLCGGGEKRGPGKKLTYLWHIPGT